MPLHGLHRKARVGAARSRGGPYTNSGERVWWPGPQLGRRRAEKLLDPRPCSKVEAKAFLLDWVWETKRSKNDSEAEKDQTREKGKLVSEGVSGCIIQRRSSRCWE